MHVVKLWKPKGGHARMHVVKLWKTIEARLMQKIVIIAIKCNESMNIAFECKRFHLDTKTLHLLQMQVYNYMQS